MNNDDYDDVEGVRSRKNRGQEIPLQNRVSNVYGNPLPDGVHEMVQELKDDKKIGARVSIYSTKSNRDF